MQCLRTLLEARRKWGEPSWCMVAQLRAACSIWPKTWATCSYSQYLSGNSSMICRSIDGQVMPSMTNGALFGAGQGRICIRDIAKRCCEGAQT